MIYPTSRLLRIQTEFSKALVEKIFINILQKCQYYNLTLNKSLSTNLYFISSLNQKSILLKLLNIFFDLVSYIYKTNNLYVLNILCLMLTLMFFKFNVNIDRFIFKVNNNN